MLNSIACRTPTGRLWRSGSAAIKKEEELASVDHSIADVDKWEDAHFKENEVRNKVKAAKKAYEDALREKFFGF